MLQNNKLLFAAALCCSLITGQVAHAQSYSGAESVEFDYANNRYLVSNTGSNQIIARASNGSLSVFATLAAAPYGIEIVGDTLYCCTGGTLRALNLNTGASVFNQVIATGSVFLNGITHDPAGNLYMTGFSNKKVYRFNTSTRQFNVFVNNTTTTPNGIIYDAYDGVSPRLVLAGWGTPATIKSISLADSSITLLTNTPFGSIDGIAKGKNGQFYISCWSNNSIQRYDSTFANAPTAMVTSGISSPADIFYNQLSDTLAVPFGSNVNFYYFGSVTNTLSPLASFEIRMFPNPTHDIICISGIPSSGKTKKLSITELGSGKLVYEQTLSDLNTSINLSMAQLGLSKGIYNLEIQDSNQLLAQKKLCID